MKTLIQACTFAASALALTLGMASSPAQAAGTSAAPAPGATALCKDGTSYSGASKRGACSGHKGVKEWYGAQSAPKATARAATPPATAAAAAGATALCKDGTSYSGASKRGACSGHKGVKEWYGAQGAARPAAPVARNTAPPASAAAPAMRQSVPAPMAAGGGAGKVWVNTESKVYHCQGDRWYGKTKNGQYMSEAQARSMGARADHGKACS